MDDVTHRSAMLPRGIPEGARFWVMWPTPKGWPDINSRAIALIAADAWVAGHMLLGHNCQAAVSAIRGEETVLVFCNDCPRPVKTPA